MSHKLGVHWIPIHNRRGDLDYIRRLQPRSIKIIDPDVQQISDAFQAVPNAIFVLRNHPISEQHDDMKRDPIGTARRHAIELFSWVEHFSRQAKERNLPFPTIKQIIVPGVNEPHVWDALAQTVDYYAELLNVGSDVGLPILALNLSVGWPANTGADTPPDWTPYEPVAHAILRKPFHKLGYHEYFGQQGPSFMWGWWAGRIGKCPWRGTEWQDRFICAELGMVKAYQNEHGDWQLDGHTGWAHLVDANAYVQSLQWMDARMQADERIFDSQIFTTDGKTQDWGSFDTPPLHDMLIAYASTPTPTPIPPPAAVPTLTHPIANPALRIITQHFGERPENYAQFGLAGHNGVDFATPMGTPVRAVDSGTVLEAQELSGYGKYVKIRHAWGESVYAHLDRRAVEAGAVVAAGFVIGLSGNSGNSTGAHLHFGIRVNPYKRGAPYDGYSDPLPYLEAAAPAPGHPDSALWNLIQEVAKEMLIPAPLLASLAWAESSFRPDVTSPAGAQGIMQIMPTTFEEWAPQVGATDPLNAKDNLRVGAAYLAWLLNKLGNEWAALHAYSWGIGNVLALREPPGDVVNYTNKVIHGADLLTAVLKEGNK